MTRTSDSSEGRHFRAGTRVVISGVPAMTDGLGRTGAADRASSGIAERFASSEVEVIDRLEQGGKYRYEGCDVWHQDGKLIFKKDGRELPFPPGAA